MIKFERRRRKKKKTNKILFEDVIFKLTMIFNNCKVVFFAWGDSNSYTHILDYSIDNVELYYYANNVLGN